MCKKLNAIGIKAAVRGFLTVFLPQLTEVFQHPDSCSEYFFLLVHLITIEGAMEGMGSDLLLAKLTDEVMKRPVVETSDATEDALLKGLLVLLSTLLSTYPPQAQSEVKQKLQKDRGIIEEIFHHCLFEVPVRPDDLDVIPPPKCKSIGCREQAFHTLLQLCSNCPYNFELVLDLVKSHHVIGGSNVYSDFAKNVSTAGKDDDATSGKAMNPRRPSVPAANQPVNAASSNMLPYGVVLSKSSTGYVGLNNAGCICYMNSTLQQFFMIPEFRQGICDYSFDGMTDNPQELNTNLLYQLQLMFANLQESEKAYYDPRGFCSSFRDFEGSPIDVMVQQDASEFITNFFQQVEGLVMGSPQENLLKDVFGGTFCNELLADGNRYSERSEPFYFISVGFGHGKNTLQEALLTFIEGETVDYTWERMENGTPVSYTHLTLPTIYSV